jgi:hypothetical protein
MDLIYNQKDTGFYDADQYKINTYAICIDSDGTGTAVQELYYQAPKLD